MRILILFLLLIPLYLKSQLFYRSQEIILLQNSTPITLFWDGGLNSPQFSHLHLSGQDRPLLCAFDRSNGSMHFYSLDNGVPSLYLPRYMAPLKPSNWAFFRDFDGDGLEDLIESGPQNGLRIRKNISLGADEFKWSSPIDLQARYSFSGNAYYAPLYIANIDIPVVDDLDGDGDLDVLTFGFASATIEHYKNFAVERGIASMWDLELVNSCYGYIEEDFSNNELSLGKKTCSNQVDNAQKSAWKHSGSSLALWRHKDIARPSLLVGDLSFGTLSEIVLQKSSFGGDSGVALNLSFPVGDPVNINLFPSAWSISEEFFGKNTLIAAPNSLSGMNNYSGVQLYLDQGSDSVQLRMQEQGFIQNQAYDMGEHSSLCFADVNKDGVTDMIMGGRGKSDGSVFTPSLHYFEGQLKDGKMLFELRNNDLGRLSSAGLISGAFPTIGDFDKNGKLDVIIGTIQGRLVHLEFDDQNELLIRNNPLRDPSGVSIDVGDYALPCLVDIDGDSWLDLLIGERNGNVNYYRNKTGGMGFEKISESFGNINVQAFPGDFGHSSPAIEKMGEQRFLLVGGRDGRIHRFALSGDGQVSSELSTEYGGIFAGEYINPQSIDLNSDGLPDLVLGHQGGGLQLYMQQDPNFIEPVSKTIEVTVYPNPLNGRHLSIGGVDEGSLINLTSLDGKTWTYNHVQGSVWLDEMADGIYTLSFSSSGITQHVKILISMLSE